MPFFLLKRSLLPLLLLAAGFSAHAQVAPPISRAEYFFDTDPGVGQGIAIAVPTPADSVSLTASIPVPAGMAPGVHQLYVRTQSESPGNIGHWSLTESAAFLVPDGLVSAEYFFDTDPGQGSGTALALPAPGDSVSASYSIVLPASLKAGPHTLYVRSRALFGAWSLAERQDFYISNAIVGGEYFFDTDPGPGNGTAIATGLAQDSISTTFSVPVASLSGGNHTLYTRTRAADGSWSLAAGTDFYILPKIVAAEYFWDTDPGVGSGTALAIAQQSDSVAEQFSVASPCLAPGLHYLYTRTRDDRGRWSLTDTLGVTFSNPAIALTTAFPGPGPDGTPVKLSGSGGTAPYLYAMNGGTPTADSIFLPANNSAVSFSATDVCGYTATASLNTPPAPTAIADAAMGSGTISFSGWRHWVYVQDAGGKVIGAVKDQGERLGPVTVSYMRNAAAPRQLPGGTYLLDRNWLVDDSAGGNSPKGIRLFALNSELAALQAVDAAVAGPGSLVFTKYNGPAEDLSPANNSWTGNSSMINPVASAAFDNGYFVEATVSSFSEFYLSRSYAIALPLRGVQPAAKAEGSSIRIDWTISGGEQADFFTVQRMAGAGWQPVGRVLHGGSGTARYSLPDNEPESGRNSYRIQITDKNGAIWYSPVVSAVKGGGRTLVFYPNPARDRLQIQGLHAPARLRIRDAGGRLVLERELTANEADIPLNGLAAGLYSVQVTDSEGSLMGQLSILP